MRLRDSRSIFAVEDHGTLVEAAGAARPVHAVWRACNGRECFRNPHGDLGETGFPCLLIVDLNIPGFDGGQARKGIKGDPPLAMLAVVIPLSTSAHPKDLDSRDRAGAGACHVKPVEYDRHVDALLPVFAYWLGRVALPGKEGIAG